MHYQNTIILYPAKYTNHLQKKSGETHPDQRADNWRVTEHIGKYSTLLEVVKRKLRWFGHVVRSKGIFVNILLQGILKVESWGKVTRKARMTVVERC